MLKNDYTIKERKADEQVKVQKGRLIKEIIIVLLCMVLGSALIELGANIRSIGKGNQSTVVPDESITLEGFVREGGGYYLQSGEGVLRCELNGEYLKKFIYDFDTKDLVDAKITVGYDNSMGKEETVTIEDRNPILLTRSVVNVGKRAKWLQISLSNIGSGILIRNIEAGNSFELNKYRIFSSNILILGICLLVIFRKKIGKEIEYGFAVIALALGIVFVISIPTNKIGWDEETHFKRAYEMSLYPGEEKVSSEIAGQFRADTFYNYPYFQPQSYEEKQNLNGLMNYYYKDGDHAVTVKGKFCGVYTPGLVPQALAMKIARAMGMPFDCIFLAGRFAELLVYVFVMFFAIRIIPMGKRILTFISLTPTSLFLAVTYTYDTVVFCFISLAFAIMMREWLAEKENVNMKRMLLANVFLIIGCLPKAIYAPVALIQTLIPAKRYENKKKRNQMMVVAGYCVSAFAGIVCYPADVKPECDGRRKRRSKCGFRPANESDFDTSVCICRGCIKEYLDQFDGFCFCRSMLQTLRPSGAGTVSVSYSDSGGISYCNRLYRKTEQEDKLETENGNFDFPWDVSGSYLDGAVRCV